jgi:cation:H+ antiporter
MWLSIVLLLVGLGLLTAGAELMVRGAERIALALGMSPLVIGLTVVSLATSAPELVVSLAAALRGNAEIAVGNVVGSNIANVALILGASAAILPMPFRPREVMREMGLMLLFTAAAWGFCAQGMTVSRWEGGLLVLAFVAYMGWQLRSHPEDSGEEGAPVDRRLTWHAPVLLVLGLVGLVAGAELMVRNATELARFFGLSEHVIGVTVVAVGTSLPELATSIMAALRRQADVSIGNALGSNVANIGLILGLTALIIPIPVAPQAVQVDWPVAMGLPLVMFFLLRGRGEMGRGFGIALLMLYAVYVSLTVWNG